MAKHVKVVAIKTGFRQGRRRRPGQEFFVPETDLIKRNADGTPFLVKGKEVPAGWFVRVKEPEPEVFEKEVKAEKPKKSEAGQSAVKPEKPDDKQDAKKPEGGEVADLI